MMEIGGYIELELPKEEKHYHENAVALNSGRNGLRYIVRAYGIKKIYVPFFTCHVVWDALREENCELSFYHIDESFLPRENIEENAYIIYTNYYGICMENIKFLAKKYKNLIVDNTMAFFMEPVGLASIYSPRKFFGVPDGGYVICDKKLTENFEQDTSWQRFSHLIKRVDCGANSAYADFNQNDDSLIGEDIKKMSNLTSKMLSAINYEDVKQKRIKNYLYLEEKLSPINKKYKFNLGKNIPMYYPFYNDKNEQVRAKLLENKIYIPRCWRETEDYTSDEIELDIHRHLLSLIIDQRYTPKDLERMVEIIYGNIGNR